MRELPFGRLDRRVVVSWRVEAAIGTALLAIPLAAVFVGAAILGNPLPLWSLAVALVVLLLLGVLLIGVVPSVRYMRWRFDVSEEEVDILEGVLIRKRTIIPLVRVQHVNTSQGPILRWLGLSTVSISTAAGEHPIPALSVEAADELRDRIAVWARVAREDV